MSTTVNYVVNGVVSTTWQRIKTSKVTWLVLGYIAVKAEEYFPVSAFESASAFKAAWAGFLPHLLGGTAGILIRAAAMKSELAAQALNPNIEHVEAVEVPKSRPNLPAASVGIVMAGLLALPGCADWKASGKYCFTDKNGNQVCIEDITAPPPPPPPAQIQEIPGAPAVGFANAGYPDPGHQAFIGTKPIEK